MSFKTIASLIATAVAVIFVIILSSVCVGHNNDQDWQLVQSPGGEIEIKDNPGYYNQGFASVYTYPRAHQFSWGPVRVTFNDGGNAEVSGTMRIRLPSNPEQRRLMHREFNGDQSMTNAERAIESHLINAIKNTGPIMSGSEHQTARKGEFYNLIFAQLEHGLYQTRKVERQLLDQLDQNGKPIIVIATEVIVDEITKQPMIQEHSPLTQYGFEVAQFSIEGTDYDAKTVELFAAKKESLLQAEKSKAQREQEVQERLMIVERGLKEKTEIEAQANKEKARLTIEAATQVSVADEQAKQAEMIKRRQTTEAQTRRDVAALNLESQRLDSQAVTVKATAEKERIGMAGAITERDRVLAEIERDKAIGVAQQLSKVAVPSTLIIGGSGGGSSDTMSNLLNMYLLKQTGIIGEPVSRQP